MTTHKQTIRCNTRRRRSNTPTAINLHLRKRIRTHYKPFKPPSVLYTFLVIPTIPSNASSAVIAPPAAPLADEIEAVAILSLDRTRSRG